MGRDEVQNIEYIEHEGRVTSINISQSTITVALTEHADCGGCPAGKLCDNFSPDRNILTINVEDPEDFKSGDFVTVRGTERLHRKAIMLATVIPSLALVAVMIGVYLLTADQLAACLSGLGAMALFFLGLYLMRNRLAHEFSFEVIKQPSVPAETSDKNDNKERTE